jgi:hypothetical protein
MALVKWARENGAVHIKVDGVELTFPPDFAQAATDPGLSPEDVVRRASRQPEFNRNAPDAVISEHPDEFAENSDRWGKFQPFSVKG